MTVRVEASGGDRRGGDVIGEGGDGGGGQAAGREFGVWTVFGVRGWRGEQLVGRSAWTVRWGELREGASGRFWAGELPRTVDVRRERALGCCFWVPLTQAPLSTLAAVGRGASSEKDMSEVRTTGRLHNTR